MNGNARIQYLFGLISLKREFSGIHVKGTEEGPTIQGNLPSTARRHKKNHRELTSEEVWHAIRNWRQWYSILQRWIPVLRWTLHRTVVTTFASDIDVGTGEAAATGLAVGATYATVYCAAGQLNRYCVFHNMPQVAVRPSFNVGKFALQQTCIFEIRLGYAMWAVLRSLGIWMKRGTHNGSSDSRAHADSNDQHS